MKSNPYPRWVAACLPLFCFISIALGQPIAGTNAPGASSTFSVALNASVTNLSLTVTGSASSYSHLLVRQGSPPTDTSFDFISSLNGQTNAIHLEQSHITNGTYFVRVRTPATSLQHAFTLLIETNSVDMRSTNRPTMEPVPGAVTGIVAPARSHFLRFELTNAANLRIALNGLGLGADLYVQRGQLPTAANFWKRSINATNDLLPLLDTEALPGSYFIAVTPPAGATSAVPYTLRVDEFTPTPLAWDPGLTHDGTLAYSDTNGVAGDYYFRITTANPSLGAWRTALRVLQGEAQLYLSRSVLPSPGVADFKSERLGSDGFILSSAQFAPNEVWYILVRASAGAQWQLVSGAPYVRDLGTVTEDGSSGSGEVEIGPEGMRFFSATVPANMLAWRLWLNGGTNSILLKKTSLPLPAANELAQARQALVVPPYLTGGQQYLIGIPGNPGAMINLDSRHQPVTDVTYGDSITASVSDFGYATYRVQVPPQQIVWQLTLPALAGNPNFAVRRNTVPNENYNDALSEIVGTIPDNISLVPPILSDGTFYITVYGTNAFQFTLNNGPATVTDIHYITTITNDIPTAVGWRYYRITDIDEQLGSLGWDLLLTSFAPGTRIALRQNAAPGIWSYRNPGLAQANYYDFLSTAEFLQRPAHQADVWYIGVYNPTNLLTNFTLVASEIQAEAMGDCMQETRTNALAGRWEFFRIEVPALAFPTPCQFSNGVWNGWFGTNGTGGTNGTTYYPVLGWDIRLMNVTAGSPQMVIRRERFPISLATTINPAGPNWPSGGQWAAGADWTQRPLAGSVNENGRLLAMGMGRPLEPGVYYIGIANAANDTNRMAYSLVSRWIGQNLAIPIQSLSWSGGLITNTLPPREAAYYQIDIPAGKRSWKVRLTTTSGEAMLVTVPNPVPNVLSEKRVQKIGKEHYLLLPSPGQDFLPAGTRYIAVIGEGQNPVNPSQIGSGFTSYVLETLGEIPEPNLGILGTTDLVHADSLEGGESKAYHFDTQPSTLGFWIFLENVLGNPATVSRPGEDLADPGLGIGIPPDNYGNEGGENSGAIASTFLTTVADPAPIETIMVKARQMTNAYPDATYQLRIREIIPDPVTFDGGTFVVSNRHPIQGQFFYIDVPPDALGWDLRLTNVTSGNPQLVVMRDFLPIFLSTAGFNPVASTNWPSAARWVAGADWTGRAFGPAGNTNENGRILAMGMGRPLEPGRYYVGVLNGGGTNALSCTLVSRGIGPGFSIPVIDIPFSGGSANVTGLAPREAAYFRVNIPSDASSWKVRLNATLGESLLIATRGTLPNVMAAPLNSATNTSGRKMQKLGDEHYLLVPPPGQTNIAAGTYYLAVVSEGVAPGAVDRVGTGSSGFTLTSVGSAEIRQLGQISFTDIVETNSLAGGEVQLYQFTVPLNTQNIEARLEDRVGNPVMVVRSGPNTADPGAFSPAAPADPYGGDGGEIGNYDAQPTLMYVPNPTNGVYTLAVKARPAPFVHTNASYTLRIRASGSISVGFDPTSFSITNQPLNTWVYFKFIVPSNALGWDVRLVNVFSGSPRMVIRRDTLPISLGTSPWTPSAATTWPSNYQWAAVSDWTRRTFNADGSVSEDGRILAMGMGRPLEPGLYYVGVINAAGTGTNVMSYTLQSRGIGPGFAIPVIDLPYTGSASAPALPTREAAYYRVIIPSNSPSWKLKLTGTSGESMLVGLRGNIPNVDSIALNGILASGKGMQKLGHEHFLLLPSPNATNLAATTNYFAVIAEGVNPASAGRVGTGTSGYTLESQGALTVTDLGLATSEDLVQPDTLEGGESKAYQFTVPPGTFGVKLRLENRVGNPTIVYRSGLILPDPAAGLSVAPADGYGAEGGYPPADGHISLITIPNALPGVYTVTVKARSTGPTLPDASYTLRVQEILVPEINFSTAQNTNGLNNVVSGLLEDNERVFFKFVIPATNDGKPVIGWKLDLVQSSGLASMRVRKDSLPADAVAGTLMPFVSASAIIVPPFLTNGIWYVEVKGAGSTAFTLTSTPLTLERPAWAMPAPGEANPTPGVTLPTFGDTGIETNGAPAAGDQSTFLQQGFLHYYAVEIPATNNGLLRAQLEAISGNPDLYLRVGAPPTLYHNGVGGAGAIYDRSMLQLSGTEYANWVPADGKLEARLRPGLWYVAVRAAGNANARYRLRFSIGNITDLALNFPELSGQVLAAGDWRYYRVRMPQTLPLTFGLTFAQQSGDVVVHLRDTIPPGNGAANNDYKDWAHDLKNHGPYLSFDPAGTYPFSAPPIRPGQVYYVGVRAINDAIFSVRTTVNSGVEPRVIPFYGGTVVTNLPPFSEALYRIDVPSDATRWKHTATHVGGVQLHLEQGTLPVKNGTEDWRSLGAPNSTLNVYLLTGWPWTTNQSYFLAVTNTTAQPQDFTFTMDGRNAVTDDNDADGLPDAWELQYFGNLNQVSAGDADRDNVSNIEEYLEGTNPNDVTNYRARLTIAAANGTVQRSPDLPSYALNSTIMLTAAPASGYAFIGWTGDASGNTNPLAVTMNTHKAITAIFKRAGDDFIAAIPVTGSSLTTTGSNVSFTKEVGEPFHAGNPGGKSIWWRWTAGSSRNVRLTTAGSVFNTLLAVYSGPNVSNLTHIASDNNSGGTSNRSVLTFSASAGATYYIAVDGYNGASGRITLGMTAGSSAPIRLLPPVRLGNGAAQFALTADPNRTYGIEVSQDLVNWTPLGSVTTLSNGAGTFIDSGATNRQQRFYRGTE